MNFYVFKISENINNFYYYYISHIEDIEFNIQVVESYAADFSHIPVNQYMNLIVGWNNVKLEKVDNITPIDVINKTYPSDSKNMSVSDDYKKMVEEVIEQIKSKPKKVSKPRAKKIKEQMLFKMLL